MNFSTHVIDFNRRLHVPDVPLPEGFGWLFPYDKPETMVALAAFMKNAIKVLRRARFYLVSTPAASARA